MEELIGNVKLNFDYYKGSDLYCDGAIEDVLLDISKKHSEDELNEVIFNNKDWAILYHFSNIRKNVIDWLPITKNDRILEIGSGCGAITGGLAKKAGSVTCIELSKKRSTINANRNEKYSNIEIMVGNFQDIEKNLTEKFDFITLIGVFEYGQLYIDSKLPYTEFLKICKSHLAPNGKLIIAIENRLGMKYFSGCTEDHFGSYFEGIEGYTNTTGVKTFSRPVLEKLFNEVGFSNYEFFYPYPDYKLPMTIYSDRYLPKTGELNNNRQIFDRDNLLSFDDAKAFDAAIKDELFPIFSNSYLVILNNGNSKSKLVYSKFSNERSTDFAIKTDIINDGEKKYVVKSPATEEAAEHINNIYNNYLKYKDCFLSQGFKLNNCVKDENSISFEFIEGVPLSEHLDELLLAEQKTQLISKLTTFIEKACPKEKLSNFEKCDKFINIFGDVNLGENEQALEFANIDLIPSNVFIDNNNTWNVIDYEWIFDFKIPVKYIIYRILRYYIYSSTTRQQLLDEKLFDKFDISEDDCNTFDQMEINFQKYVVGKHHTLLDMYNIFGKKTTTLHEIFNTINKNKQETKPQIFFNREKGYNENDSIILDSDFFSETVANIRIPISGNEKTLRVDPASCEIILMLDKIDAYDENDNLISSGIKYSTNGKKLKKNAYLFSTNDPQIIINNIPNGTDHLIISAIANKISSAIANTL